MLHPLLGFESSRQITNISLWVANAQSLVCMFTAVVNSQVWENENKTVCFSTVSFKHNTYLEFVHVQIF